ncbi:hypothetical protein EMIT074MI3_11523 [Bacillus licheniformis]
MRNKCVPPRPYSSNVLTMLSRKQADISDFARLYEFNPFLSQ